MYSGASVRAWAKGLKERVAALRQEITDKQNQLSRAEEQLNLLTRLLDLEVGQNSGGSQVLKDDVQPHVSNERSDRLAGSDIGDAVASVLKAAGEPRHISIIRQALIDRGVAIPGKGDAANIIVRISPDQRFVRTARGTYSLAEWGLPTLASIRKRARRNRVTRH